MMSKTIDYYMRLPYTVELTPDLEEGWFVAIKELPGCISQGETAEEALEMIQDAKQAWIEIALEDDQHIPEPRPEESHSGRFNLRVLKSLHRRLVEEAEREGVSLNHYINVVLADSVSGAEAPIRAARMSKKEYQFLWPGLSETLIDVLNMAGLDREAGEVDERMFSDWVARMLSKINSAWVNEYYQEALKDLETITVILRQHMDRSPAIESLVMSLELQCDLLKYAIYTRQAMARQPIDRALENRFRDAYQLRPEPPTTPDKRDLYKAQIKDSSDKYEVTEEYSKLTGQGNDE